MDLDDLFARGSHDRDRRQPTRRRRRAHPHAFAWLMIGGGVLALGGVVLVLLSSLGLWGTLADAYFAFTYAVLPATWHDEWSALPGAAHVALVLGALFVAAGLVGEIFD